MAIKLSEEEFRALVVEALDELPEFFQQKLQNIEVVVTDWPTAEELRAVGVSHRYNLLGLYEGVPLTRRTSHYGLVLPDKVTIFQGPIQRICRSRAQIISQVKRTVRHELAHHFGISDDRLRELGAY